jgi:hypothetical protein
MPLKAFLTCASASGAIDRPLLSVFTEQPSTPTWRLVKKHNERTPRRNIEGELTNSWHADYRLSFDNKRVKDIIFEVPIVPILIEEGCRVLIYGFVGLFAHKQQLLIMIVRGRIAKSLGESLTVK